MLKPRKRICRCRCQMQMQMRPVMDVCTWTLGGFLFFSLPNVFFGGTLALRYTFGGLAALDALKYCACTPQIHPRPHGAALVVSRIGMADSLPLPRPCGICRVCFYPSACWRWLIGGGAHGGRLPHLDPRSGQGSCNASCEPARYLRSSSTQQ
jgi:hypothetical protein